MTLGRIQLDPEKTPGYCHVADLTPESADMASRCLQANKSANHIFTTSEKEMGLFLHNHVVYHVLTLFALGASPQTILAQTKRNFAYQLLPPKYPDEATIKAMEEPDKFKGFVGKEEHFLDLCEFFERQIDQSGYEEVLQKYLVGDDELAKNLFPRMYHGYVHGIMHIGLGLEFNQMPILAEGLAEAAVHHDDYYTEYIDACADVASKAEESLLTMVEVFDEAAKDGKITSCSSWDYVKQYQPPSEEFPEGRWFVTREPYRDGVVGLVKNEMARIAGRWRVTEQDDLERKTAEIIARSCLHEDDRQIQAGPTIVPTRNGSSRAARKATSSQPAATGINLQCRCQGARWAQAFPI